ncbi:MAG: sodium:solute symporter [Cytophagales bacterium]|nr:sodium:solute symporter [Cytophagales bacterium]
MSSLDWTVLFSTLLGIVGYGTWKTYKNKNIQTFIGGKEENWTTVGLSVMATQASAITFLSTPGLGYDSGLGFVQFYFGLPIALVVICAVFLPIYYKLNVLTAYEFLESRFNPQTRTLTAVLFLIQRGLAAGITIYAPSIILSTALGWNINLTNMLVGVLVIVYTVSGGTRAVSITHKWQMAVIFLGMFAAFFVLVGKIREHAGLMGAFDLAGAMSHMEVLSFKIDPTDKYTIWSGLTGGFFLALSYFGTDQSQVQRYLSGKSLKQSRMGLLFNGVLKIPMQFFILIIGVLLFVFYQFEKPPVYFDQNSVEQAKLKGFAPEFAAIEQSHARVFEKKKEQALQYIDAVRLSKNSEARILRAGLRASEAEVETLRDKTKELLGRAEVEVRSKETDYVFISFVMKYLPQGLIGLLLAVILSAAMSSTAGELNALGSTATVDIYKRWIKPEASEAHYLAASKWITVLWGGLALAFATFAYMVENLIEAVNILGSLFYGTILGIFLVAFFFKRINGRATFWAAAFSELVVVVLFMTTDVGYLWFNAVGCSLVIAGAVFLSAMGDRFNYFSD